LEAFAQEYAITCGVMRVFATAGSTGKSVASASSAVLRCAVLVSASLLLSACVSKKLAVYPADSPKAASAPVEATLSNIWGEGGKISLILPDGEPCFGRWSTTKRRFAGIGSNSLLQAGGESVERDVAIAGGVSSSRNGQASLHCDYGTFVEMDFVTRRGTSNGSGIARDSKGNHYLVIL
jgi:hypothetical protein